MTQRQKRILVASSLTAGGEALTPVVKRMQRTPNMRIHVLAHKAGFKSFDASGIRFGRDQADNLHLEKISPEICRKTLIAKNPTTVLTGTQVQEKEDEQTFEQMLWQIAKERGIKSIAVLDTWDNYIERFCDLKPLPDGNRLTIKKGTELRYLPDTIAVIDEFAKKEMMELGFPEGILAVTGSPYFEHVLTEAEKLTPETRRQFLERPVFSEFDSDGKTIVFMSDSIEGFYPDIGFTEKSVLQSFLKIVDEVVEQTGMKINVIVRPHPFRNENAQEAYECETPNIVKVFHNPVTARGSDPKNEYSMEELLHSADLVVGTFNNPLITAKLMGRPVINYQLNMNEKYHFQDYLSKQDLTTKVTKEQKLGKAIIGLLNGTIIQKTMEAAKGATDRIIRLLE